MLEEPTFEKEFRADAYRDGDWKDLLLFILWYRGTISLFSALRDDVPKLDDLLKKSLYGVLKATERDASPLVALWKEEIRQLRRLSSKIWPIVKMLRLSVTEAEIAADRGTVQYPQRHIVKRWTVLLGRPSFCIRKSNSEKYWFFYHYYLSPLVEEIGF